MQSCRIYLKLQKFCCFYTFNILILEKGSRFQKRSYFKRNSFYFLHSQIKDEWTVKGANSKSSKQSQQQHHQSNSNRATNGRGRGRGSAGRGANVNGHAAGGAGGGGAGGRGGRGVRGENTQQRQTQSASSLARDHQSNGNFIASSVPPGFAQPQPQQVSSPSEKTNVPKLAWALNNNLSISNNNAPTTTTTLTTTTTTTNSTNNSQQVEDAQQMEDKEEDVVSSKPEKRPPADENKLAEFPPKPAKRFSLGRATTFATNHFLIPWPKNNGFDFEKIKQYDVTIREQKSAQKRVVESTALGV
jgi:hypothetical protein